MAGNDTQMLGQAKGVNQNLATLISAIKSAFTGNAAQGQFTMAAANSATVPCTLVKSTSFIALTPLNAAAATLQSGVSSLYVVPASTIPGTSFTVHTASSTAAGGEIFGYIVANVP
jgi:hypothetical protein